jgi:type III restriction enzyme
MERLKKWCEDINAIQKNIHFDYVFVEEEEFEKFEPKSFSDLVTNFR